MATSCMDGSEKGPDGQTYFKRIIRLAADHERQQLPLKWQHENEVLEVSLTVSVSLVCKLN
jgi:hypothetical protein